MKFRKTEEVAKMLAELFNVRFSEGANRRNNFQIARADLLKLAGRPILDDKVYQETFASA